MLLIYIEIFLIILFTCIASTMSGSVYFFFLLFILLLSFTLMMYHVYPLQ